MNREREGSGERQIVHGKGQAYTGLEEREAEQWEQSRMDQSSEHVS